MDIKQAAKKALAAGRQILKEVGPIRIDARIDLTPGQRPSLDGDIHLQQNQPKELQLTDESDQPND